MSKMLRRILRKHAWPLYRYYDNLLRVPPRAVVWRIYKRVVMERYWARRCAREIAAWSGKQRSRRVDLEMESVARDWLAGKGAKHFCDQPDPARTAALARQLCPEQVDRTIRRADEFMAGRFRLLEAKPEVMLADGAHPDWVADPLRDIEWPHALNRFRKYARCLSRACRYTGDVKYAERLLALMEDWIDSNPRGRPMAWSSMEISLRSLEWNAALFALRGCPALDAARLVHLWRSLEAQLDHLRRLPEIELSDNHLVYNLGALVIAAMVWPELRGSARLRAWAMPRFLHELRRQHRADGFNVEQSTHYFAQVARLYAEAWALGQLNGPDAADIQPFVMKFLDNLAGLMRPDRTLPLLSDAFTSFFEDSASDDARTLLGWGGVVFDRPDWRCAAGTLTEEAVWMLGTRALQFNAPVKARARSALTLRESGYYVAHSADAANRDRADSRDSYLVVDAGPLGFPAVPAHGHPDLLSFEWWHRGQPVVVDPGTYEYEPGEWAFYFRRTRAHATVTVDAQDQSTQWGFARWVDLPQYAVHATGWRDEIFWLDAQHHGYERLDEPVRHRRRICWLAPDLLVVEDLLTGRGQHRFEQTFPLAHNASCDADGSSGVRIRSGDSTVYLQCLASPSGTTLATPRGQREPLIWGWSAPNYGFCEPATVVVFAAEATVPARFVTVLCSSAMERSPGNTGVWATGDGRFRLTVGGVRGFRAEEVRDGGVVRSAAVDADGQKGSAQESAGDAPGGGWMITHSEKRA